MKPEGLLGSGARDAIIWYNTHMRKLCLFIASGFGLGLFAPFAPGTFGSIPGVALAYAVAFQPVAWLQLPLCLLLAFLAVPVCDVAEKMLGIKDDGRITADEWMLYPLALLGIPILSLPWWSMVVFFCVIRLVDIVKPWPCRGLQNLPGGYGIVADDFVANLYSLGVNWLIFLFFFKT